MSNNQETYVGIESVINEMFARFAIVLFFISLVFLAISFGLYVIIDMFINIPEAVKTLILQILINVISSLLIYIISYVVYKVIDYLINPAKDLIRLNNSNKKTTDKQTLNSAILYLAVTNPSDLDWDRLRSDLVKKSKVLTSSEYINLRNNYDSQTKLSK